MTTSRSRSWLRRLLAVCGASLFALLLAEVGLRVLGLAPPGFQPYPATHVRGLFQPRDDDRGYGYTPSFVAQVERAGSTTEVAVNARGFRDAPFTQPADGTLKVLTVGCSLTAGWGVDADQSWPKQLEARLRDLGVEARVFNAGVTGYNMRQARLTAEELLSELQPDVVVMGLYPMGYDRIELPFGVFEGYLVREFQMPRLRLEDDGFFQTIFRSEGRQDLDQFLHHYSWVGAYAMRALGNAKRAVQEPKRGPDLSAEAVRAGLDPLLAEVTVLQDACAAANAKFAALVIAIQEDDGSYSDFQQTMADIVDEHLTGRGIANAPTLGPFRDEAHGEPVFKLPGDLHWSARAHSRGAELLAPVVAQAAGRK